VNLELTDTAAERVRALLGADPELGGFGLRVAVETGGCAGFRYDLSLAPAAEADDMVLDHDGFRIFVDPDSSGLLDGVRIDYVDSLAQSGFRFENPNATRSCGCGTSFDADQPDEVEAPDRDDPILRARVEEAIDCLRPHLQADGGDIEVLRISDGVVSVRLRGACAGCTSGMDSTLRVVERRVLDEVSEVHRVVHVP
jgi:iron-sulfur cluster assembly protein